jgi:Ser/Thr protein kinase RdoA (MazF antagonist)
VHADLVSGNLLVDGRLSAGIDFGDLNVAILARAGEA